MKECTLSNLTLMAWLGSRSNLTLYQFKKMYKYELKMIYEDYKGWKLIQEAVKNVKE